MCRTVCVGTPTAERQAAYELYLRAQQTTVVGVKARAGVADLEQILHGALKDASHGDHIFGPPIHGEKDPDPLRANVVIAVALPSLP